MIALLAGTITVGIPMAIYACFRAHFDMLAQDEWQ
jgi:hypothetical protein